MLALALHHITYLSHCPASNPSFVTSITSWNDYTGNFVRGQADAKHHPPFTIPGNPSLLSIKAREGGWDAESKLKLNVLIETTYLPGEHCEE